MRVSWITRPLFAVGLLLLAPLAGSGQQTPPLGATLKASTATFRVWAPFVEAVSVRINGGAPIPLAKEAGHPASDDTIWVGKATNVRAGAKYRYVIRRDGQTREFADPRALALTGSKADAESVLVAPLPAQPPFSAPRFNEMVIYELHLGTFHRSSRTGRFDFAGAIEQLDHLKSLGVNVVEVMPIHENIERQDNTPTDYNWGYDPVQLFAVERSYGAPRSFWEFVKQCHDRKIAVVLDVVYNHLFQDNRLNDFGGFDAPNLQNGIFFYGDARLDTGFGPRPDYGRPQVRDYIRENALMWLRTYGVDGLRWDSTINIRAFEDGRRQIPDGARVLRESNDAYRNTLPREPGKLSVAEDLQGAAELVTPTGQGGLGFNSQWDDQLFFALRRAVTAVRDEERNLGDISAALQRRFGDDVFRRVIYTENHDKVGHPGGSSDGKPEVRLPRLIDQGDPESVFAKKRSTLAAAILLTAPGIPLLFQGQEMLETRPFEFEKATPVDWQRVTRFSGIVQMYRDLIALRRNLSGKTRGLTRQGVNVFHRDEQNKTLAYHRFGDGGAGDDVIIVVNLSNSRRTNLNVGFPRGGLWRVRFNSGAAVYDAGFTDGDSSDVQANAGVRQGLGFNGNVSIGPYSVVILSQD